jgi:molecular chaperone GrpE
LTAPDKPPETGAGTGEGLPPEDGVIIEFVDHEEEGPHQVGSERLETPATRPGNGPDQGTKAPAPAAASPSQAAAFEERIMEAEDRFLRLMADFENHRKRTEREREDLRRTAASGLVRDLLPVFDNLERAASHLPENCPEEFSRGLALVLKQFQDAMVKAGLETVEAEGKPFDPTFHEACAMVATGDLPPNHVVDVIQRGYTMGGKLLRPARVRVSAAPAGEGGQHA